MAVAFYTDFMFSGFRLLNPDVGSGLACGQIKLFVLSMDMLVLQKACADGTRR